MTKPHTTYRQLGVDPYKNDVLRAVKGLGPGIFPHSFCRVLPDIISGDASRCLVMHADGAGSKALLAYLYWKETGDASVWEGVAQDALVMNVDDLLCVGCTEPAVFTVTIGRNRSRVPGEVVEAIVAGFQKLQQWFEGMGHSLLYAGGETADLADQVATLTVDCTIVSSMPRNRVITCGGITGGDVIVGLGSAGQANFEKEENSGIGSNGLTLARHALLSPRYAKDYPEISGAAAGKPPVGLPGKGLLTDPVKDSTLNLGRALLSPTRSYFPVLLEILKSHRDSIHAIVHCTGGGQTKILNYAGKRQVVKDNLFPLPPIFRDLAQVVDHKELYEVFNMGHRMEIYVPPHVASAMISTIGDFGVPARVVGYVEDAGEGGLRIRSAPGIFSYRSPADPPVS